MFVLKHGARVFRNDAMVGFTKKIKGRVRVNDRGEIKQQEGAKRDREADEGRERGRERRERERDGHIDRY